MQMYTELDRTQALAGVPCTRRTSRDARQAGRVRGAAQLQHVDKARDEDERAHRLRDKVKIDGARVQGQGARAGARRKEELLSADIEAAPRGMRADRVRPGRAGARREDRLRRGGARGDARRADAAVKRPAIEGTGQDRRLAPQGGRRGGARPIRSGDGHI